jgi:peptidyl-prolyl cis-trans isomerase A (cyclophilin A)
MSVYCQTLPEASRRFVAITCAILIPFSLIGPKIANASVVRFNTVLGNVDVRLYDSATPLNVANFLNYTTSGRYAGTFIHRDLPGFVIQGGGYTYDATSGSAPHIAEFGQVNNEFRISNLRGTIAMAKLAAPADGGPPNGGPNSATSEWFFNLADSNASGSNGLDSQNGGYTVFGRVVGTGMTVVDAIAALQTYDLDGASASTFDDVPIRTGATGLADGLVFLNSVQVLNYKAGDYDFNGTVNAADYTVWRNSFGSTTNAVADGNGDGIVDMRDYVVWRNTLGQSGGPGAGSGSLVNGGSVPEPSSSLLALGVCLSCGLVRRRRST